MGHRELDAERRELADELAAVMVRRARQWRADHGDGADYSALSVGGLALITVSTFRALHIEANKRPIEFDHLASACCEYAHGPLVQEAARQCGVTLVNPLAAALVGVLLGGVPAHD